MTSMGARQHLLQLEESNLVESFSKAEKVGRPSQYWQLTGEGHQRFPDSYGQLSVSLIESVRTVFGDEGLEKLILQREQDIFHRYIAALEHANSLVARLDTLVSLRSEEGYMASWYKEENSFWLVENHCPICSAAESCQQFCRSELTLFQKCLGDEVSVVRTDHVLEGARRCAYRIEPKVA